MNSSIDQQYLKDVLEYNPDTGRFTWRYRPAPSFADGRAYKMFCKRFAGQVAGHLNPRGYVQLLVKGRLYYAHRLAFLYMTGEMPLLQIDHLNHNRSDNRWRNLREVPHNENCKNQRLPRSNKSGVLGVRYIESRKRWRAEATLNGTRIFIGSFKNKDDAIRARSEFNKKHGFHKHHGSLLAAKPNRNQPKFVSSRDIPKSTLGK